MRDDRSNSAKLGLLWERALDVKSPSRVEDLEELRQELWRAKQFDEAIAVGYSIFDECLADEIRSFAPESAVNLCVMLFERDRFDEQEHVIEKALAAELLPTSPVTGFLYWGKFMLQSKRSDLVGGLQSLETALAFFEDFKEMKADVLRCRGEAKTDLALPEEALEDYEAAIDALSESDDQSVGIHCRMAVVELLIDMGRLDEARKSMIATSKLLEFYDLDDAAQEMFLIEGRYWHAKGEFEKARDVLGRASSWTTTREQSRLAAVARLLDAQCLASLDRLVEAVDAFSAMLPVLEHLKLDKELDAARRALAVVAGRLSRATVSR